MLELFFPNCSVELVGQNDSVLELSIHSKQKEALCPDCRCKSNRVHSYYHRSPSDLPFCGWLARIHLLAKRFRCLNVDCQRCTFVETFGEWLPKHAQRTTRLQIIQSKVAVYLGGEAGACLLSELGMPISPDSLLTKLHVFDCDFTENVRVLGIDDFSFRRGKTFGTILVDLEKHKTIDLLEDRSAKTLIDWLKKHPEIEIISRDRSGEYARASTKGAPQAQQVADRWHLLVNLSDLIEKWLERNRKQLIDPSNEGEKPEEINELTDSPIRADVETLDVTNYFVKHQLVKLETRAKRFAQYEQAKELRAKGLSWNLVAAIVGKGSSTLRRWFREGVSNKERGTNLDPYRPYLKRRILEGCHNGLQLHRELELQGFEGTTVAVQKYLALFLRGAHTEAFMPDRTEPKRYTPREGFVLFTKDESLLSDTQKARLEHLKQTLEQATVCHELTKSFIDMFHQADSSSFESWLEKAQMSGIQLFRQFAKSLSNDASAVKAGMDLPWSNGMVEGKVNKLKLIKRQMYGRASFDLLRKRVILAG